MRDLYNRKKKLEYWMAKIYSVLDRDDKKDVLKFVETMQEKDQSILTITRCISIIIQIRNKLINRYLKWVKTISKPLTDLVLY